MEQLDEILNLESRQQSAVGSENLQPTQTRSAPKKQTPKKQRAHTANQQQPQSATLMNPQQTNQSVLDELQQPSTKKKKEPKAQSLIKKRQIKKDQKNLQELEANQVLKQVTRLFNRLQRQQSSQSTPPDVANSEQFSQLNLLIMKHTQKVKYDDLKQWQIDEEQMLVGLLEPINKRLIDVAQQINNLTIERQYLVKIKEKIDDKAQALKQAQEKQPIEQPKTKYIDELTDLLSDSKPVMESVQEEVKIQEFNYKEDIQIYRYEQECENVWKYMQSENIQRFLPYCLQPRRREDRGLVVQPQNDSEIVLADEEINDAMNESRSSCADDMFGFN